MRSTVLGGEVLTELESDGYYSRAFVYAGGAVLATQERWGGSEQVSWEHRDPSNASFRMTSTTTVTKLSELDPVGADAGVTDGSSQSIPDEGSLAAYPSFNNPAQPNMTYAIDGVRVPLDHFMVMFNLNFKSNLYLAEQVAGASTPRLIGYSVWNHSEHSRTHYGLNTFGRAYPDALEEGNFALDWSVSSNWDFDSSLLPQNTVTAPLGDLRGNLEKILKQGNCEEYTTKLLAEAAKMFAGNYPHMKTIMEGYGLINSSKGGGYILKQSSFDTVDGDLFANGARPGAVWLVPNRQYGSMTARQIAEFQADYAWTALHETLHLGTQGGYRDEDLASAAYELAGRERPTTYWNALKRQWLPVSTLTGYERETFFSNRFDEELKIHCPPLKQ